MRNIEFIGYLYISLLYYIVGVGEGNATREELALAGEITHPSEPKGDLR